MCIALRWVDSSLLAHEDFMGLYEVADASAKTLASMIQDVILRCGLDISNLRGQGYDGCINMTGRESGVAKRIQQVESTAVFVHCAAHSMNSAIQDAATAAPIIRDCLSLVHELVIFRNSPTNSHTAERATAIKQQRGVIEASVSDSLERTCCKHCVRPQELRRSPPSSGRNLGEKRRQWHQSLGFSVHSRTVRLSVCPQDGTGCV